MLAEAERIELPRPCGSPVFETGSVAIHRIALPGSSARMDAAWQPRNVGDFDLVKSAPSAHQKSLAHQLSLVVLPTKIDVAV